MIEVRTLLAVLAATSPGLDSVRARTHDEGWTTVAGDRVRMPEPRC